MDVEQRLRNALHEGATAVDMHGRGPAAAQRRGRRLVHRRRAIPAALTAAMIGGTAFAVWPRNGNGGDDKITVGPVGASPNAPAGNDRFDWRAADATVVAGRKVFVGSDGAYYALSTAPGTRSQDYPVGDAPQALYRSTDGTSWEPTTLGDKPWIVDLAERDGVLYALGTAPGAADSIVPRVATSTDGGANWTDVDLPTVAAPPSGATVPLQSSGVRPALALSGGHLVATLRTSYWFDPNVVLTSAESDAGMYASIGPDGIDVYAVNADGDSSCFEGEAPAQILAPDPNAVDTDAEKRALEREVARVRAAAGGNPCTADISRSLSWSDLGLTSGDDLAVNEMFASDDGGSWHAVATPFGPGDTVDVTAVPDGFLATATHFDTNGNVDGVTVARSSDGETWQTDDGAAAVGQLSYAGVVGSRVVAVQSNNGIGAHIVTSDDGGRTWNETDLGPLVTDGNPNEVYVGAFDAGPLGVGLTVSLPGADATSQFLLTSPDGASWTVTPLTAIADASGKPLTDVAYVEWVAVGADDLVLNVTQAGSEKQVQHTTTFVGTPTA